MELGGLVGGLLSDYTLRSVALGSAVLGLVNGALGSFAVLRRQSLLGDAISHAALPGIALAFLLTGSKSTVVLLLGAGAACWVGTVLISSVTANTRIKYDSALGLVLSVFFGFGLVLLTYIQRLPLATQAGLDRFLFGQAATLVTRDVLFNSVLGVAILAAVLVFWKELKLLSFDPDYAESAGFPVRALDILLTTLLVAAIVTGLQTVGVVLMSALVVAPAAAARQWTDRLGVMVTLSAAFGAAAGAAGALVSSAYARTPTGPAIVLCVAVLVALSFVAAPNRGLAWRWGRKIANRRRLEVAAVLSDLYVLARQHPGEERAHKTTVLRTMSLGHGGTDRSLKVLQARGLVARAGTQAWALTPKGLAEAERVFGRGEEGP